MSVLRVKTKRENFRQVTIEISQRANTYITLFALSKGIARTVLVRDIIDEWLTAQPSDTNIITLLANRLRRQWYIQKSLQTTDTAKTKQELITYLHKLEDELRKKGVEEPHIEAIVNEITSHATD